MIKADKYQQKKQQKFLVSVWKNSRQLCKSRFRAETPKICVKFKKLEVAMAPKFDTTMVKVLKMTPLESAMFLRKKGYHPLILNEADAMESGNAAAKAGKLTPDADLHRRSNIGQAVQKDMLPLEETDCIYTRGVMIFRDDQKTNYKLCQPYKMDYITAAPLDHPERNSETKRLLRKKDAEFFREKMRELFHVAYLFGHDSIVLNDWGCGAAECPPKQTAQLFQEVIAEMSGCFRIVIFAVQNEKNNKYFQEILETAAAAV